MDGCILDRLEVCVVVFCNLCDGGRCFCLLLGLGDMFDLSTLCVLVSFFRFRVGHMKVGAASSLSELDGVIKSSSRTSCCEWRG